MSHPDQLHVALLPSVGMGHLTPFLRLAALLQRRRCRVTLVTMNPTVSLAESRLISRFIASFPAGQLTHLELDLIPLDPAELPGNVDPFWLRFEAFRRSAHGLIPLLRSVPSSLPLSALVFDVSLISPAIPVAEALALPAYILFTSSARMLSFISHLPNLFASDENDPFNGVTSLQIPGILPEIPRSSFPPLLLNPNSIFAKILKNDAPKLRGLSGVLINSFEELEPGALATLEAGNAENLPRVHALGPFEPCEFEKAKAPETALEWLDEQLYDSVVYVSFGSRTALPREQIKAIGGGLVKSGYRFLWVVKDKQVDREEGETSLKEVMGREVWEKMKETGFVVNHWVDQSAILAHGAVGGFVSHCGWNSVVETALHGVRVMAWPQGGDQMINAEVVAGCRLGMWLKTTDGALVGADEICERVRELMGSEELRCRAAEIGEAAKSAAAGGLRREEVLSRLFAEWSRN